MSGKTILFLIAIAAVVYWFIRRLTSTKKHTGTSQDIHMHLQKLIRATDPAAFLIIEVSETGDFLQFSEHDGVVQMDFPLITTRQKQREETLATVCSQMGLTLEKTKGSDGSEFMDYNLTGDASSISSTVQKVFQQVFDVSGDQALVFKTSGV
jgi:hypothetical protein